MSQIILLGTEGCGKTILLTVLAQKYRSVAEDGTFLETKSAEANAFTNLNWHILNEQHDWPSKTMPGSIRHFSWKLHFGKRRIPPESAFTPVQWSAKHYEWRMQNSDGRSAVHSKGILRTNPESGGFGTHL